MRYMNLSEIRNTFIQYFKKNNHKEIKSSNLVPDNDPTLLFTNSGMVSALENPPFSSHQSGWEK